MAPRGTGWPAAAIVGGLLLTLVIPPPLLDLWGLDYTTSSGAPWAKLHPGSDLIALGVAGLAVRGSAPGAWLAAQVRGFPGTVIFAAATLFLASYAGLILKAPATPLIDTFLVPAILLIGLAELDQAWQARFEAALHGFLALNAMLGIAEFTGGWRLIPVTIGDVLQTADVEPRAFGLMGHPLTSAATAGLYAVILMMGGGRRLPAGCRAAALALQFVALAAFGGRTALVMAVLCLGVTGCVAVLRLLGGRPIDLRLAAFAFLAAPLLVGVMAAAASGGFFDTILDRFASDNGSAHSREIIFDLFGFMSWQDLLLGPDQAYVAALQNHLGIEAGVESFWLGLLFFCGLLPAAIFLTGLALFLRDVMRRARPGALVPLLFFGGIVSSSVSLSAKTAMLAHFVALVLILMPRRAAPVRCVAAAAAPPSNWVPA